VRILIIGASGSGTTTLGESLSLEYGWGFLDVDNYYWLPTNPPFQNKRNHCKRLEMILNDLSQYDDSVVSGSIMNWGQDLEDSFDLIVFLYLDSEIRVERIKIEKKFVLAQ
jgi:adenylate kinase family enzyme